MKKDILERLEDSRLEIERVNREHELLPLLKEAQDEIRAGRAALSSNVIRERMTVFNNPVFLAALSGAAATVATRHDCPPEKLVKAAIAIADAAGESAC